jgi:GxxExxY protein
MAAGYKVHSTLGPGMLEHAYCVCLAEELRLDRLEIRTEVPVPVIYKGVKLEAIGYRMDLLVEGEIVIEVKSLEGIAPVHLAQLVSYLKLADRRLGFLFNFNVESFRDGIYRRVNKFESSSG